MIRFLSASCLVAATSAAAQDPDAPSDTIVVTGERAVTRYEAEDTTVFGYAPIDIQEVPQSVQVLTRAFIDDTGALSLGQLMQNVPGASNTLGRTTPFGTASLQLRGQEAAIFRDGLRDVDFSDVDQSALNNVASVDVLKGPAGLVFGTGGPGGVVNVVTKRPTDEFAATAQATIGERDTRILAADVSVPLGRGFGLRATGETERSDGFVDFSGVERDNYSGVLAYDDGGGLSAALLYESFESRDDDAMTRVGLPTGGTITDTDVIRIDRETYLGEPASDFTDSRGTMLTANATYEINESLRVEGAARRVWVVFDQAEVRTLGSLDLETLAVPRSRARELALEEDQINLRGLVGADFATGPITHDLTVGYERFEFDLFVDNRSVPGDAVTPTSVVAPTYRDEPLPLGAPFVFTTRDRTDEVFAQDVVRFGDTTVTGAVRHVEATFEDSFGTDEALTETLGQIGAAHALSDAVSVFAGYATGFDANSGIAVERSRTNERFDPETYGQVELGLKTDDWRGITATLSVFELTREGILVTDPQDAAFLVQVGEERSRGVEADVLWSPTDALALRAGYLYLDAEVTEDTDDARRGNRRPGAPEHRANLFAAYTVPAGPLEALTLTGTVTYNGKAFASLDNDLVQPDYALVDLGASYVLGPVRLDFFASNVLDERTFTARNELTVNPGDPRLVRLRATVAF